MTATVYGLTDEAVQTLQTVLEFLTANPDKHRQGTWLYKQPDKGVKLEPADVAKCGTYGCLAGHLALFGNEIPFEAWLPRMYHDQVEYWDIDFEVFNPIVAAEKALGVDYQSARGDNRAALARQQLDRMFQGDRSIDELWFMAQRLADGRLNIPAGVEPSNPNYWGDEDDTDW